MSFVPATISRRATSAVRSTALPKSGWIRSRVMGTKRETAGDEGAARAQLLVALALRDDGCDGEHGGALGQLDRLETKARAWNHRAIAAHRSPRRRRSPSARAAALPAAHIGSDSRRHHRRRNQRVRDPPHRSLPSKRPDMVCEQRRDALVQRHAGRRAVAHDDPKRDQHDCGDHHAPVERLGAAFGPTARASLGVL